MLILSKTLCAELLHFRQPRGHLAELPIAAHARERGQALGYYINRSESGAPGTFTREEADKQLEEVIARIAAKQAIEKAQKA